MRFVLAAVLFVIAGGVARADSLTLVCLDVGRAVAACRDSAARFEEATGHTVRVVSADATDRRALERYRALFSVSSPRIDVIQFPDAWAPALTSDLSTLANEADPRAALPAVSDVAVSTGRVVGLPQHMAITLLFLRSDQISEGPEAWTQLRESLLQAPGEEASKLAFGGAGASLFPLFVDWAYSFGAKGLDDEPRMLVALQALNDTVGVITSAAATSTTGSEALAEFTGGGSAALLARSTALPSLVGSPIADVMSILLRPPAEDAADAEAIMATTWFVGVSRHSANQESAKALATFLASPDEQRLAAIDHGLAPTRPALYDDEELLAVSPVFATIASHMNRLVPPPVRRFGIAYLDLADQVADAVRAMVRGEVKADATMKIILDQVAQAEREAM
ncbi:extracellular solute-binding protein [Acuticoccus mangrovi]|uniref:Extracellular solute-binding protein n=1 Tax=Acuticoccus mangrovi TaxID=2796142 RepID=A0A934MEF0_9HYPH|nr:extracellular solute-binding protein [Acuticoccus mangrovi]MBJ3777432.1 extracellular solute-binding protein [Acuticoccus mangrovi]